MRNSRTENVNAAVQLLGKFNEATRFRGIAKNGMVRIERAAMPGRVFYPMT